MAAARKRCCPTREVEAYTQGLMDLGAAMCVRTHPRAASARCTTLAWPGASSAPQSFLHHGPPEFCPSARTTMLVLLRQGEVLLEKRPAPGIWGGLWCFPEMERGRRGAGVLARYGLEVTAQRRLDADRARLHALPVAHHAGAGHGQRQSVQELGRLWLTPEDALGAAIPVPVKRS